MLPVINAFKAAHQLAEVTVVADAGMISEANQVALQDAGLTFILGARIPFLPYQVTNGATSIPTRRSPTGRCSPSLAGDQQREGPRHPGPGRSTTSTAHDRARRTLRGIDEQVAKAEKAVDGQAAVKRNRFVQLTGATKTVNRDLEAKTRALAGLEGLHHQPAPASPPSS